MKEWTEDIFTNIPNVLVSCGPVRPLFDIGLLFFPIHTVTSLGKGLCDLVLMPVAEMRKEDGHIVKGIQRGAGSFGVSTAAAIVDIAQRVVGAVQASLALLQSSFRWRQSWLSTWFLLTIPT